MRNEKISFYTETGKLIEEGKYEENDTGYVILGTIQSEQSLRDLAKTFSVDDLNLSKKYLRNYQVVNSDKKYHFETTGKIYGFGFGPVYRYNPDTKYSIEKFAKSKSLTTFPENF